VVDQTAGDASLVWGGVQPQSFRRMVEAALAEYPGAQVLIRTHPDVLAGRRRGCIDPALMRLPRVSLARADVHPASLLAGARAVYVASSQLGFEALLFGRPVRCFGMPFYAGRGLSVDELPAPAWRGPVPLERLVHAALVQYPRYIDPDTHAPSTPERVLEHLALQRRMRDRFPGPLCAVGFSAWKRPLVRRFLRGSDLRFARKPEALRAGETAVVWGQGQVASAARGCIRLEDGFLRSVGLGADLVSPLSWVADPVGIYYDPGRPSRLEELLLQGAVPAPLLERAARLRERVVASGLSKYNLQGECWRRPLGAVEVVLVVGQVPADASVRLAASGVRTDRELLRAARAMHPRAYLVYRPHPDVVAGLRVGQRMPGNDVALCDETSTEASITSLIDGADAVHVLSSLAGFEALLREKPVHCHGMPFYAGWGLTEDAAPHPRRNRVVTLDELVAAALILYPTYVNRAGTHYIEAERALDELLDWREQRRSPLQSLQRTLLRPLLGMTASLRDKSLTK
jgi:capsular polysaccharide export protein